MGRKGWLAGQEASSGVTGLSVVVPPPRVLLGWQGVGSWGPWAATGQPLRAGWRCSRRPGVSNLQNLAPLQGLSQPSCRPLPASALLGVLTLVAQEQTAPEAQATSTDSISLFFNLHAEDLGQPKVLSGHLQSLLGPSGSLPSNVH